LGTAPGVAARSGQWAPEFDLDYGTSPTFDYMKIHEFQAKAILREFGVPVPAGEVAETSSQARAIAQKLGRRVVVKAQVHAGGRGKAGGVKLADDPAAAEVAAREILGKK